MKLKPTLFLAALLCLFPGCAWLRTPQAGAIAERAAYRATYEILLDHPEWRAGFVKAADDLSALAEQPHYDVAAVLEVLQRLPVKELRSRTARITYDGVFLVVESVGDPTVKPEGEQALRNVVTGLAAGVRRGLQP